MLKKANQLNRREFLTTTSVAAASIPCFVTSEVSAATGRRNAKEQMKVGINLEIGKTEHWKAKQTMKRVAEAGYKYVEAYVYSDIMMPINSHLTIRSDTSYYHFHTGQTDTKAINALRKELGLTFSGLDAHCSLLLPQFGVQYLKAAIDFAAKVECPIVMSDEGPLSMGWMDLDKCFDIMCFSLEEVFKHARSVGVRYAMELHNALTARPDYLIKLLDRFGPEDLGVNFDTGNAFLAGNDPVEYLKKVASRVIHMHIKDIPESMLHLRGKVTGTRVGVASGDGVINLHGVVEVLRGIGFDGVLSIECDTYYEAKRSLAYLQGLIDQSGG